MRTLPLFLLTLAVSLTTVLSAQAQTGTSAPAAQSTQANAGVVNVIGEVKSIDASAKQIIVRTDNGSLTTINLSEKTQYLRVAPGEKSLTNATKITVADVGEGDRILAQGRSTDQKSVPALRLVVMTKADVAKKQEKESIEWQARHQRHRRFAQHFNKRDYRFQSQPGGSSAVDHSSHHRQGNDATLSAGYNSKVQRSQAQ